MLTSAVRRRQKTSRLLQALGLRLVMHISCKNCSNQMVYEEGPGHLWKSECEFCGFKEEGTFSPAYKHDRELSNLTKCKLYLSSVSEIVKLKKVVKSIADKPNSEILEKLKSNSMVWEFDEMPLAEALRYQALFKEQGLNFVYKNP